MIGDDDAMEPSAIEREIIERLQRAVESTAADCVRELNDRGHRFVIDEGGLLEWIDESSGLVLEISSVLGVSVAPHTEPSAPSDPEVEAYLAIAEAGTDPLATVLNELEGDVANGGFLQLLENKGPAFFSDAIERLREIGATETAAVVGDALRLIESSAPALAAYSDFVSRVDDLDARFVELTESVARLYLRHRRIDTT